MKLMTSRIAEAARSHGRIACKLALAPSNPATPTKPKGRQQAKLVSAAMTAATGLARSATGTFYSFCFASVIADLTMSSGGIPFPFE